MRVITIYHNISTDVYGRPIGMLDGYMPGHALVPVARYVEENATDNLVEACERAFHLFNVGDDPAYGTPDPRAVAYRDNKNRSLSNGDVVQIRNGQVMHWLACTSVGWRNVDSPEWLTVGASRHGTTGMSREEYAPRGAHV